MTQPEIQRARGGLRGNSKDEHIMFIIMIDMG